jgi:D-alanyl-lipoteichoic acid acyltransferase DltB (MBOAT superfamily)
MSQNESGFKLKMVIDGEKSYQTQTYHFFVLGTFKILLGILKSVIIVNSSKKNPIIQENNKSRQRHGKRGSQIHDW